MNEKYILIAIVIIIIAIVFIALVLIVKNSNKTVVVNKTKNKNKNSASKKKYTIKEMNEVAARRDSSREDLKKAIDIVKKELIFPKKIKQKLPKDIKIYLNFVLLIASHRNADAKLIAYASRELKKANPEYTTEIDIYENEGVSERSKRI